MTKLTQYSDRQYISGGRFSEVYKATDTTAVPHKVVALKVTTPDEDRPPHNSRQEVTLLRQFRAERHPNIIQLLGDFTADAVDQVIVLPYYPYTLNHYLTLNSTLVKQRFNPYLLKTDPDSDEDRSPAYKNNLSQDKARKIILGIASGLRFLHDKGIIHRDIKPENILFQNFDPVPVIIDFGISYKYPDNHGREPSDKKITDVSTGIYKAPELLFGICDYSFGVDIWSLGILMTKIFSKDTKPALDDEGYGDLRLVSLIFKTFGTPTLETWPEAKKSKTFSRLELVPKDGIPIDDVLPNADPDIKLLFQKMMVFESTRRLTPSEILGTLTGCS